MPNNSKFDPTRHQELARFSQSLTEADFRDELAYHCIQVGVGPTQQFIFDGQWHKCDAAENAYKGKVKYIAEWRVSKSGVRYPFATFFSYKHGGESATYNGYNDVVDLFQGNHTPAPTPPTPKQSRSEKQEPDYEYYKKNIIKTWRASYSLDHIKSDPARAYLKHRGLGDIVDKNDLPKTLRCHPQLGYYDGSSGKRVLLGYYPAIIAAVQAPDNKTVSLRRIYLQSDGNGKADVPSQKKIMPPSRPNGLRGAATRLYAADEKLAVAEGIETALAIRVATGLPVWAAGDCYGLEHLIIPDCVKELLVCADHDSHGKGERAAHRLAARIARQGVVVKVAAPAKAGSDWLDVLIQKGVAA